MNERYKNLMTQQSIAPDATDNFYNKLETAKPQGRKEYWKIGLIAACLCLLIPASVLAAKYAFGVAEIRKINENTFPGQEGYYISLDNVKSYPMEAFAEELQSLKENKTVYYDSWKDAEAALGIDLLENEVLIDGNTHPINHFLTPGYHCAGRYMVTEGQFYAASTFAAYQRDRVSFEVKANVTAQTAEKAEDFMDLFHGTYSAYSKKYDPNIMTEQYTTKHGIPVTLIVVELEDLTEYSAIFAVNNVSYKVRILGRYTSEKCERDVLLEVLDGFVLE